MVKASEFSELTLYFSGMHNYFNVWPRVSVSQLHIDQITDIGGISLPVQSFMLMSYQ